MTFIINGTQHNNALPLCWVLHFAYCYDECRNVEYRYAECCILFIVMLNVAMLSIVILYDAFIYCYSECSIYLLLF